MAKPVVFTVDDDPEVLHAIERDLRRQYGGQFRIMGATSGEKALDTLKQLKLRNDAVALLLADQRMPHMTGVEFLGQALNLFPDAKRALLTAYADTTAAVEAINTIGVDYYLMKPWDPPEEHLYPPLQDMLDDWMADYRPPFQGVRVIGHQWSSASHQIKDFLSRNQIPYRWLDIEHNEEAQRLLQHTDLDSARLPVAIFPDGSSLALPTNAQLAEKVGLKTHAGKPFYDLIIVGAGPAGLAAAVYGASEGLHTLLWLGLRWGSKQIGNLFDTFGEIELRLLSQTVAVGLGSVEKLGFDVEEGVVLGVLGCGGVLVHKGCAVTWWLYTHV